MRAQDRPVHSYGLEFKANSSVIDTTFADNARNLNGLVDYLSDLVSDPEVTVTNILIRASTSPEGSHEFNTRLAKKRLESIYDEVMKIGGISEEVIVEQNKGIAWDALRSLIMVSREDFAEEVLEILEKDEVLVPYHGGLTIDQRVYDLMNLRRGAVWKKLKKDYFPQLRTMFVIDIRYKRELSVENSIERPEAVPDVVLKHGEEAVIQMGAPVLVREFEEYHMPVWKQGMYVKTNGLGWLAGMTNAAVEFDLCRHLSVNLPVYYSGWNYFTSTIKFRTILSKPEIRYWFDEDNDGVFLGAHFGVASYNVAVDGGFRYQDMDGKHPALGGGVTIGYRMPLLRTDGRLRLEFTLGLGAYDLRYDYFHNTENVLEGAYVGSDRKTWIGPDGASVSLVYMFHSEPYRKR